MRVVATLAIILVCAVEAGAQRVGQVQSAPTPLASQATPQTETVGTVQPGPAKPQPAQGGEGYLEPAQVKELLRKVWLAEYRINDLLTEVHPERWKLAAVARDSFRQTLETLRAQMAALEGWRGQLNGRPDNAYLAYATHAAMGAVLPRLDAVARSITQHENPSLGAQFSQADNQLFDLQQGLGLYLGALLRYQDQVLQATQGNLAACQNDLGYALRGRAAAAKPMKNVLPNFRGRGRSSQRGAAASTGKTQTTPPAQSATKK
jgi:hypothetical protein